MLSKKITDGTIMVVFDMEWNQPFSGKTISNEITVLPGEIIEIGAVKYEYSNGKIYKKDTFSCDIRPVIYRKLHYHVMKITHKTDSDLKKGISFEEAWDGFKTFMGGADLLIGWGNSDPKILKCNLKFFGLDDQIGIDFLDLQPIFSVFCGQPGQQKSVEFAVDYYNIAKKDIFHSATADAQYTGEVLEEIFDHNKPVEVISAISSSSVNPDMPSEFSFLGSDVEEADKAFNEVKDKILICPLCSATLAQNIPPFRIRKSQYALLNCSKHGDIFARVRAKRRSGGKYYAAVVMRFATQNDYYLVASKKEEYDKYGEKGAPPPAPEPAPERDEQTNCE
ncbi:MAG: exonuclease domain-containing protein [Clostridiales bacterium]|nr:exonuclease domain-containing protein [Clostridiales bacterium]MBO4578885.1 exonuclease domain-containing protein [Clostridiales bacterium]